MTAQGPVAADPAVDHPYREATPDLSTISAAARLRKLLANALSLLLAYILPRILTIGAIILAARELGATRFGEYGTATAFAVLLSIVATLGMQPLLIREMSRAPADAARWMRAAHLVKLVSNALMLTLLVAIAGPVMGYSAEIVNAAALLGIAYAIGAYADNLAAWFQSVERMEVWMQASACYGLVTGIAGAILVITTHSVVWFCAAPVVGQAAAVAWLAYRAPPGMRFGARAGRHEVVTLLRALVPFAAGFIALTAHSKVDVLILAGMWPAGEVGVYTAAHKFIDIVQALAVVGAAAIYPRLSRAGTGASERTTAAKLLEFTFIAGLIGGGTLYLARSFAVGTLFGLEYGDAVRVTGLLAFAIAPLAFNIVAGYALAAAGRMGTVAMLYTCALALKVGLNAWLVPAGGAAGTAIALTATEVALAAGMVLVLRRAMHAAPGRRAAIAGGLAAVAWAALALIRDPTGGIAAAFAFALLAALACTSAGIVPRSDRALLAAALRGAEDGS